MQNAPTANRIQQASFLKRLALFPAGLVHRAWAKSLRIHFDPVIQDRLLTEPRGVLIVLWHNRLFLAPSLHTRMRGPSKRFFGLVSASRDGAWLSAAFEQFGLSTIRGSSSRRGASALREILRVLSAGHDVGITLDGPRGPAYEAKEGIGLLARHTGASIVYVVPHYKNAWRLRSWDRFFLPKPFSRVDLRLHVEDDTASLYAGMDSAAIGVAIGKKLHRLSAGSDPEWKL